MAMIILGGYPSIENTALIIQCIHLTPRMLELFLVCFNAYSKNAGKISEIRSNLDARVFSSPSS
jgi:hypothetical protein